MTDVLVKQGSNQQTAPLGATQFEKVNDQQAWCRVKTSSRVGTLIEQDWHMKGLKIDKLN